MPAEEPASEEDMSETMSQAESAGAVEGRDGSSMPARTDADRRTCSPRSFASTNVRGGPLAPDGGTLSQAGLLYACLRRGSGFSYFAAQPGRVAVFSLSFLPWFVQGCHESVRAYFRGFWRVRHSGDVQEILCRCSGEYGAFGVGPYVAYAHLCRRLRPHR